jgi:hypothetical protein
LGFSEQKKAKLNTPYWTDETFEHFASAVVPCGRSLSFDVTTSENVSLAADMVKQAIKTGQSVL